jgi:hypothetical protein
MIFLDALSMKFRNVKLRERNMKCAACGPECPKEEKVLDVASFDYGEFCQTNCDRFALIDLPQENRINVHQFMELLESEDCKKYALIDVRP